MKTDNSFKPDPSLLEGSKFHDNVTQVYIRTTEDKLLNFLNDFREAHGKLLQWTVPLGLSASLAATLLTTSFTDKYSRPAAFWESLFVSFFVVSVVWLVIAVVRALACRKSASVSALIKRIKNDP
jgi:hypothetical protein